MTAFFMLRHDCTVFFKQVFQVFHRNGACFGVGCYGESCACAGSLSGSHAGRFHVLRGKCRSVSADTASGNKQIAAVFRKQGTARHGRDDFRLVIDLFSVVGAGIV